MNYSGFIENRIKNIQDTDKLAFEAAMGVGPWVVPLAPAIIVGFAFFQSASTEMELLRVIAAIAIGAALITAGAISSHVAIVGGKTPVWGLVFLYIILEIGGLWALSVTGDLKIAGTVASLLTLVVYLSRASARQVDEAKKEDKEEKAIRIEYQIEQARLTAEHQRQMDRQQAELDQAAKLAKIEANKEKAIAKLNVTSSVPKVSHDVSRDVSRDDTIIAALSNGKVNKTQLAEQLGVSRNTIYRDIERLESEGKLSQTSNGYEVIANGQK
jgi:uncharacterized membrane protein YhiD involved in acid resistance